MSSQGLSSHFLVALILAAFFVVGQIFLPFLAPLVLAASFAAVLQPLYQWLLRRTDENRDLSAFATLVLMLLGILVPLGIIMTLIGWEAAKLYTSVAEGTFATTVSDTVREAQHILPSSQGGSDYSDMVAGSVSTYMRSALVWLSENITQTFSSIASLALDLFIFFLALFFFLRDGESIKQSIIRLSPLSDRDDQLVFDRLGEAVNSVIRGNLMIALIRGVFSAVGFFLFGVPNPALWGIVAGIVGLIPAVGIVIVFTPAILYAFFQVGWVSALALLLWGVFVVGLIDNLLAPRFVGRGMQLHPLLVFLGIFGGLAYFGPVGLFLGPLSVSFLVALLSIYSTPARKTKPDTLPA